jgi:succinate dehydrogenase/fumarate reductase flavoprotein subunit
MEFGIPRGGWCFARKYQMMGMNMFQGNGAILVNRLGERFMEKYEPVLKERAPTYILHLALTKEGVEGRGPIYMDMTNFTPETWERCRRVIPRAIRIFEESGLKPWKEKIVFDMGTGGIWCQVGGIKNNIFCETSVPGLYVAGQSGGYPAHGTYSVGGINLALCCVGGYRAGEYAARYAEHCTPRELNEDQVKRLVEETFSPMGRKGETNADTIDKEIRDLIHPAAHAIFKNQERILTVLAGLEKINELLPEVSAPDAHELVKANEMRNYLQCVELIYRACLERTESRGALSREDYPYRDDIDWLKWVILYPQDGGVRHRLESIPLYRYPFRPKKLEKIPARILPPKIS